MFYKQKNQIQRWWFDHCIRGALDTPPVRLDADIAAPVVLSQLQHKDVLMYLAASKSFARHIPLAEVHVVDDGSLTADDRNLLSRHIPGIRIHALASFRVPGLPNGGTWERLIAITRFSEARYVIQLDADTLTLASIPEVAAAVKSETAFSIGTWDHQRIEPALDRSAAAKSHLVGERPHVQLLAEANFANLHEAETLKYVRGCSGFSGFPAGMDKIDLLYAISSQMQTLIGERWLEWGSEQVMSNLVVANQPGAIVLPHPEYADCEKMRPGTTRFVHFIGTCRFRGGRYRRLVNRVAQDLNRASL